MEDFILREIDRLGEMLMLIVRKLGLLDADTPDYFLFEADRPLPPLWVTGVLMRWNLATKIRKLQSLQKRIRMHNVW